MDKEILLDKSTMIVSQTDLKGNILYANNDFCKIAEYSKDELIGQPHNLLRHPDMPKAAFKDLWETLQRGEVWNGIVKNKTKSGDYYWVNATAYSVTKKAGEKTLISVRTKPTASEVTEAKTLYKKLKETE